MRDGADTPEGVSDGERGGTVIFLVGCDVEDAAESRWWASIHKRPSSNSLFSKRAYRVPAAENLFLPDLTQPFRHIKISCKCYNKSHMLHTARATKLRARSHGSSKQLCRSSKRHQNPAWNFPRRTSPRFGGKLCYGQSLGKWQNLSIKAGKGIFHILLR